jgi:hypothetical protein
MAISSRVRRANLSCPESGGGFKANASGRNPPQTRETKRNEANPKPNRRFRFAPRKASFATADEIGDFASPCGFNDLRRVSFRRAPRGRPAAAKSLAADGHCRRGFDSCKAIVRQVGWRASVAR